MLMKTWVTNLASTEGHRTAFRLRDLYVGARVVLRGRYGIARPEESPPEEGKMASSERYRRERRLEKVNAIRAVGPRGSELLCLLLSFPQSHLLPSLMSVPVSLFRCLKCLFFHGANCSIEMVQTASIVGLQHLCAHGNLARTAHYAQSELEDAREDRNEDWRAQSSPRRRAAVRKKSEDQDGRTAFDHLSPCQQRRASANAPIRALSNHQPRHARASISHHRPGFPPLPHICPRRTQNLIAHLPVSLSSPSPLFTDTSSLLCEPPHPPHPHTVDAGSDLYRDPYSLSLRCSYHLPRGDPGAPPDRFQTLRHRGTTLHSLGVRLRVGRAQRVWRGLLGMSSFIAPAIVLLHHTRLLPSSSSAHSHPNQAWQVAQPRTCLVCRHRTMDGRQAMGPF